MKMRILHTSDWHLGRTLYGRRRYDEFSAFLDWLSTVIAAEDVDALLVAGDVFDTTSPSNRAQELYYKFLCKVAASSCRNIVIIGGNHDSPSFLSAPKELLRTLNVFVVGAKTDNPADEVIVLYDEKRCPQAVVCAVPYLRDRDVRTVEPGENIDDKNLKLVLGVKKHYEDVFALAQQKKIELQSEGFRDLPVIGMGHLFTAGGKTVDGDGVRELYVGSLAHVEHDVFPKGIDYLALGHLHVPQIVGKCEYICYSGSPLPMGFGEAEQDKKIILVEFTGCEPAVSGKKIPCFQKLIRIAGTLEEIQGKIEQLKSEKSTAWLEIEYTGRDIVVNLCDIVDGFLEGSSMEVCRVRNKRVLDRLLESSCHNETLDDLDAGDVFSRCLDSYNIPGGDREELTASYNEIVQTLEEDDTNKE